MRGSPAINRGVAFRRGRLAEALFPPRDIEQDTLKDTQRDETLNVIHHSPDHYGHARSRWTLALLQQSAPPLKSLKTLSGVWRRLHKWNIRWKRGRSHVTSPDPQYDAKLKAIDQVKQSLLQEPERLTVLYADEVSCYRQPVVGTAWHERGGSGKSQKRAYRSHASNTHYRFAATLDVQTGRVLFRGNSRIGVSQLCEFLKQVRRSYGPERRVVLIWDNWPIHFYDNVLAEAKKQEIELLHLPTYAPWTNPVEKLWRKLKEEILAMHHMSNRWKELVQRIRAFLQQYDKPAPDLLRYVGLAAK